jgi:peptide/nickel transport system substrate-binding protein
MARQKFMSGTSGEYGYDSQDRFIGPDGEQVELRFALVSGNQTGEIIANYLTQRLEQIGITTDIVSQNFGNVLGNFLRNSPDNNPGFEGEPSYQAVGPYNNGAFDESISAEPWDILYGIRFTGNPFSPWGTIKALLGTQAQFNFMGYTPEIDIPAEVDKAATASSEDETRSVMSDLFEFLARDQPLVWLYNNTPVAGYREPVTGLPEPDSFWDRPDARTIGLSTTQ